MREIPAGSKVYVETSVLVEFLLGEQTGKSKDHKCLQFFKDIEKGQITGVSSLLAVYEAMDVLKRTISEIDAQDMPKEQVDKLHNFIFQKMDKLGIRIDDIDTSELQESNSSILTNAGQYVESTPVVFDREKYNVRTSNYGAWDTVGLMDSMHLVMAEQAGVDCLITNDRHFKRFSGSSVESILVWEAYQ